MPRLKQQPDNQLNLIADFEAVNREPQVKESKENKEAIADRVIKEIYKKIELAEQKARDKEKKITMVSIKGIREEIKKEEGAETKEPKDEYIEPFSPSEEYYGRWNKFRKRKN
jgi:hypothetical protein